jgi:hypothetical protein
MFPPPERLLRYSIFVRSASNRHATRHAQQDFLCPSLGSKVVTARYRTLNDFSEFASVKDFTRIFCVHLRARNASAVLKFRSSPEKAFNTIGQKQQSRNFR